MRRWLSLLILAAPGAALAQPSATPPAVGGAAAPPASAAPPPALDKPPGLCVERLPEGKARPRVTEKIAARGTKAAHTFRDALGRLEPQIRAIFEQAQSRIGERLIRKGA